MRGVVTEYVDRVHVSAICQDGCGELWSEAGDASEREHARRHTRKTGHRTAVTVEEVRYYVASPKVAS